MEPRSSSMATVGYYSSITQKQAQINESDHSTTAHLLIHAESPCRPHQPCRVILQQGRVLQRLGAVSGCEGQRGLAFESASEWSHGLLHKQQIGTLTWAPLASALPSSRARVLVWEEGKLHLKGRESAQARTSGLLLQQLVIGPCPQQGSKGH